MHFYSLIFVNVYSSFLGFLWLIWAKKVYLIYALKDRQLLLTMCPFIYTFNFDLIFGFLGLKLAIFGLRKGSITVFESTHITEQILYVFYIPFHSDLI